MDTHRRWIRRTFAALCIGTIASSVLVHAQTRARLQRLETPPLTAAEPAKASGTVDLSAGYKLEAGPFDVETIMLELSIAGREEPLSLLIRAPKVKEGEQVAQLPDTIPLVIISHGAGGSKLAFGPLSEHWASHGYAVVHPTHDDSLMQRRARGERMPRSAGGVINNVRPAERVADVKAILDELASIESAVPGWRGDEHRITKIDRDRIAVAGHSAGALTAMMAIGTKVRGLRMGTGLLNGHQSIGDERVRAAIVISGQGADRPMLSEDSWKHITKPMLVISGSLDTSPAFPTTPERRCDPFKFSSDTVIEGESADPLGPNKFLLFIEGATHGSYQGKSPTWAGREQPTTDLSIITNTVSASSLAFLDRALKSDADAQKYLTSESIERLSGGKATLEHK